MPERRDPEFAINRAGHVVKTVGPPRPATDAALRFLAYIETVDDDPTPHRIWRGGRRFRIDDDLVTTPARAALILIGDQLRPGARPRPTCGVAGCVAFSHLEVER